jgi:protein-disulfide isomerase
VQFQPVSGKRLRQLLHGNNLKDNIADWARATPSLNRVQFERCVSESLTSGQIEQDVALGQELGVRGTPTVFLNGELVNASSEDEFRTLIRHAAALP